MAMFVCSTSFLRVTVVHASAVSQQTHGLFDKHQLEEQSLLERTINTAFRAYCTNKSMGHMPSSESHIRLAGKDIFSFIKPNVHHRVQKVLPLDTGVT
jgi:hypothetical protein